MAVGDQADILARLRAVLPTGWFASTTPGDPSTSPILDGLLAGPAWVGSWLYQLLVYVADQRRLATASGINLDLIANDFFGKGLQRFTREPDDRYRARIQAALFAPKATRAAVIAAGRALTGIDPIVFEPANTMDTGGYGSLGMTRGTGLGYNRAGGYGSLRLPFQAFVKAFRPHGGGIQLSQGYYSLATRGPAIGGYGAGRLQYASLDMMSGVVSDEDIMAALAAAAPIATILWTAIDNASGVALPTYTTGHLFQVQESQTLSATAFIGHTEGVLSVFQDAQTLNARATAGVITGALSLTQAAQILGGSILTGAVTWNPSDEVGITLSSDDLTATSNGGGATGVRSTEGITAGKIYVEMGTLNATLNAGYGLSTAAYALDDPNGIGGTTSIGMSSTGAIFYNNSLLGFIDGSPYSGGVIGMAIDLDSSPPKVWFRIDGGAWGQGADDPTTGVGGWDISGLTSGPIFLTFDTYDNGSSVVANFGATPFAFAPPSGFVGWRATGSTPPSAPTGLTTSNETNTSIVLSWSPSH